MKIEITDDLINTIINDVEKGLSLKYDSKTPVVIKDLYNCIFYNCCNHVDDEIVKVVKHNLYKPCNTLDDGGFNVLFGKVCQTFIKKHKT